MATDLITVKWDESTKEMFRLARRESVLLGDDYVGTQHLLLAVVALQPPELHGLPELTRDAVLTAIVRLVGLRDPDNVLLSPGGQTPRAKEAIIHAMERAREQSRSVSICDMWLGLLGDEKSNCRIIIGHLGLQPHQLIDKLAR